MQQVASLLVAQDIQGRAQADAARRRRYVDAPSDDTKAHGKRWTIRLRSGVSFHRRSADRAGA